MPVSFISAMGLYGMLINFAVLAIGLVILVISADKFVLGTASIARQFGVSPLLIGLTIVGFGTSAPEILVSVIASYEGNPGLAIGNAIGSNIANIALILGVTAIISPLAFKSELLGRELPILMLISLACYFLAFDGLGSIDASVMIALLIGFLYWLVNTANNEIKNKTTADPLEQELLDEIPEEIPVKQAWMYFCLGLVGLLFSSRLIVWAAIKIAVLLGVSDLVIGLTIVALGTSLPELAASISSVLKKEDDLAVGNVIGSNIYNLLAVYSMPGFLAPGPVEENVLYRDFPVMLGLTAVLFVLGYGFSKQGQISRFEGGFLFASFCAYQWTVYHSVV